MPHQFVDQFPFLDRGAYLNTAAEGLLPRASQAALVRYAEDKARGAAGRPAMYAVEQACREQLAKLLGVTAGEVALLASTARGIDAVIQALPWSAGDNVVTDDLEFPTTLFAAQRLQQRGVGSRIVTSRAGRFTVEDVAACLDERTRLVCVSAVSFNSGLRLDLPRLAQVVHAAGAQLLVDVAQAAGAVSTDAGAADFLVGCSFKWLIGAHGVGFLVVNRRTVADVEPHYVGWRSVRDFFATDRLERVDFWPDARRFEEGMPNYTGIYALAESLTYLDALGSTLVAQRIDSLVDRAMRGLCALGITPLTPEEPGMRAGISSFEHARCREITARLAELDIHVWGGDGRIRVSPHFYNEDQDVDAFLNGLESLLRTHHDTGAEAAS
jgi:cysteine desulfurase/selenocysteine lyase